MRSDRWVCAGEVLLPFAALTLPLADAVRLPVLSYGSFLLAAGGLVGAAVAVGLRWKRGPRPKRFRTSVCVGLALCVGYLIARPYLVEPGSFFFVYAAGWALLRHLARPEAPTAVARRSVMTFALCYGLASLLEEALLWSVQAGDVLASILAGLRDKTGWGVHSLSFTYAGGWPAIVAIPAIVGALVSGSSPRATLRAFMSFSLLVGGLVWQWFDPDLLRLWALMAAAVGIASFCGMSRLHEDAPRKWSGNPAAIGGALAAVGVLWVFGSAVRELRHRSVPDGKVVLLEGGYDAALPDADNPAPPQGAAIGYAVRLLEWHDLTVERTAAPVTREGLGGAAVAIVCNLNRPLTSAEIDTLVAYVEGGGYLWILGDHTNLFGAMDHTNPLAERFGVSLQFDSAMPLNRKDWTGGLRARWHPTTAMLPVDRLRLSVGASLHLRGPAKPLIVATPAFADAGDRGAPQRGFLGDWTYKPPERLGDLVVAASVLHGKGKVLVFGDTALFQQTSLSDSWSFIVRFLEWAPVPSWQKQDIPWQGVLALGIGSLALLGLRGRPTWLYVFVALPLVARIGIQVWAHAEAGAPSLRAGETAFLDFDNGSSLARAGRDGHAVNGFADALASCGFLPLFSDRIAGGRNVLVVPPGRGAVDGRTAERYLDFVKSGGVLIVTAGPEDASALEPLLAGAGVRLSTTPLGTCPQAKVREGWPLPTFRQAWGLAILPEADDTETLVSCWEMPVVTFRRLGDGVAVVIADPDFLKDLNFISGGRYQVENFAFIRRLVSLP